MHGRLRFYPLRSRGGVGKDINGRYPVVVLVRSNKKRWDEGFDIFDTQDSFCADAVLREEVIERGAEELAVDEELEGDGLRSL